MGATFGAVHVKGAGLDEVVEAIVDDLGDRGFERLSDDAPASDVERRVVVFEDGGWTVVADEDATLDADRADELGCELSERFETDAIVIGVFHSDTAILARYVGGEERGRFQVPEDGKLDEASGHRRIATKFLADLATSAQAKKELSAGLLGDWTFPEQTVFAAAERIGLPHPGASASAPPSEKKKPKKKANVVRLRFALPQEEEASVVPEAIAWRPPGTSDHAIFIAPVVTCVGMPLMDFVTVQVEAYAGERIEDLTIELSGTALGLMDVSALAGWNPDIGPGRQTEIMVVELERSGDARGVRTARFPKASLAPAPHPTLAGTSAAALRAWSAALHDRSKNLFVFHLRGKASAAGKGELAIRILDREGRPLDTNDARVAFDVAPAPRMPVLPPGAAAQTVLAGDDPHAARRIVTAAQTYAGDAWLCGWLGFDAPFAAHDAFLLESASALASWIGRSALEVSITSAGTHPKVKKRFSPGDRLGDFSVVTKHLADEADVKLHVSYEDIANESRSGAADGSYVCLRHQPHGTTVFDAATRAALPSRGPEQRIVPLDLSFAIRRPKDDAACAELAAVVDAIVAKAASSGAACVGAFVAAMGGVLGDYGTPYEELVGVHDHERVDVVRKRPRSPGWRVVLPGRGLVKSPAATPFAMTDLDREAIERAVAAYPRDDARDDSGAFSD